jgi:hypothetical protein
MFLPEIAESKQVLFKMTVFGQIFKIFFRVLFLTPFPFDSMYFQWSVSNV